MQQKLDEIANKYYHKNFKDCCPIQKARIKRVVKMLCSKEPTTTLVSGVRKKEKPKTTEKPCVTLA